MPIIHHEVFTLMTAHGEVTRHDPVLKRVFGFKRMANFKAVMRLFNKFTQGTNEAVMDSLYRWMFGQLSINGITLDLDSTVMTRHGKQEGAVRGYNPAKRGRASHHPLMAFVADTRMIANCWLRPGNSSSANNAQAFLANTLHRLGGKQVALLRADSGFSDSAFWRISMSSEPATSSRCARISPCNAHW